MNWDTCHYCHVAQSSGDKLTSCLLVTYVFKLNICKKNFIYTCWNFSGKGENSEGYCLIGYISMGSKLVS